MDFASSHVYLGQSEEAEVSEDLLEIVEQSGGLSNVIQQQQQPRSQSLIRSGLLDDDDCEAAPKGGKKEKAHKPKKAGFFSRLFGSSSSSKKDAAPKGGESLARERSDSSASDGESPAAPTPAAQNAFASFLNASPPPPPQAGPASAAAPAAPGLGGVAGAVCGEPMRPPGRNGAVNANNKKVHKRAVDTNVLAVKFSTLARSAEQLFAGDAILCEGCTAALNHLSTLLDHKGERVKGASASASSSSASASAPGGAPIPVPLDAPAALPQHIQLQEGQLFWACEFCAHENVLDGIQPEEIPTVASRDYVIEPAPESSSKLAGGESDGLILFCLDISGSMCVSAPVAGKIKLRGAKEIDPSLLALGDVDMSGVGGNVTYVSRLQSVQASISAQIQQLQKQQPNKRVGLITFNGDVMIIGDGSLDPVVVTGDKLNNHEALTKIGAEYAGISQGIGASANKLEQALFSLEETGPTALGPALVTAIAIASKQRGSTILVCTDGLANVGLGSMTDKNVSPAELEEWYSAQGALAKAAGVTVSVVSIKGDECKLEALGLVAAETGGAVERVDPTSIEKEFGAMLSNPVVATNVRCTFFLHNGMQFRNDDAQQAAEQAQQEEEKRRQKKQAPVAADAPALDKLADAAAALPDDVPAAPAIAAKDSVPHNKLSRDIGNVWAESEANLEYGLKSGAELSKYAHLKALPFQVQIEFTTLTGMRALRVLTQAQPVTLDRAVAERDVKLELLSAQVAQKSAALAKQGRYKEARMHWLGSTPMLQRVAQSDQQKHVFSNYAANIDMFDRSMAGQQRLEEQAEADEVAGGVPQAPQASIASGSAAPRKMMKKSKMSDETYRVLHKTTQLNSAGLM